MAEKYFEGNESKVLMHDFTLRYVCDLVEGDLLMGEHGEPVKVLDTFECENSLLFVKCKEIDSGDVMYLPWSLNLFLVDEEKKVFPWSFSEAERDLFFCSDKKGFLFNCFIDLKDDSLPSNIDPYTFGQSLGISSPEKEEKGVLQRCNSEGDIFLSSLPKENLTVESLTKKVLGGLYHHVLFNTEETRREILSGIVDVLALFHPEKGSVKILADYHRYHLLSLLSRVSGCPPSKIKRYESAVESSGKYMFTFPLASLLSLSVPKIRNFTHSLERSRKEETSKEISKVWCTFRMVQCQKIRGVRVDAGTFILLPNFVAI